MEKLEARVSHVFDDGAHSLITRQILHSSNLKEMTHKATLHEQTTVIWQLVMSLATYMRKKKYCVCHPVCPTDSSSHFCLQNSICPWQQSQAVIIMEGDK